MTNTSQILTKSISLTMKITIIIAASFLLSGCAGSYVDAQNRTDGIEVSVNNRIIRVFDYGERIEFIRKGYIISAETSKHVEDFSKASKQATGCDVRNLLNVPGTDGNVWMVGTKDCN